MSDKNRAPDIIKVLAYRDLCEKRHGVVVEIVRNAISYCCTAENIILLTNWKLGACLADHFSQYVEQDQDINSVFDTATHIVQLARHCMGRTDFFLVNTSYFSQILPHMVNFFKYCTTMIRKLKKPQIGYELQANIIETVAFLTAFAYGTPGTSNYTHAEDADFRSQGRMALQQTNVVSHLWEARSALAKNKSSKTSKAYKDLQVSITSNLLKIMHHVSRDIAHSIYFCQGGGIDFLMSMKRTSKNSDEVVAIVGRLIMHGPRCTMYVNCKKILKWICTSLHAQREAKQMLSKELFIILCYLCQNEAACFPLMYPPEVVHADKPVEDNASKESNGLLLGDSDMHITTRNLWYSFEYVAGLVDIGSNNVIHALFRSLVTFFIRLFSATAENSTRAQKFNQLHLSPFQLPTYDHMFTGEELGMQGRQAIADLCNCFVKVISKVTANSSTASSSVKKMNTETTCMMAHLFELAHNSFEQKVPSLEISTVKSLATLVLARIEQDYPARAVAEKLFSFISLLLKQRSEILESCILPALIKIIFKEYDVEQVAAPKKKKTKDGGEKRRELPTKNVTLLNKSMPYFIRIQCIDVVYAQIISHPTISNTFLEASQLLPRLAHFGEQLKKNFKIQSDRKRNKSAHKTRDNTKPKSELPMLKPIEPSKMNTARSPRAASKSESKVQDSTYHKEFEKLVTTFLSRMFEILYLVTMVGSSNVKERIVLHAPPLSDVAHDLGLCLGNANVAKKSSEDILELHENARLFFELAFELSELEQKYISSPRTTLPRQIDALAQMLRQKPCNTPYTMTSVVCMIIALLKQEADQPEMEFIHNLTASCLVELTTTLLTRVLLLYAFVDQGPLRLSFTCHIANLDCPRLENSESQVAGKMFALFEMFCRQSLEFQLWIREFESFHDENASSFAPSTYFRSGIRAQFLDKAQPINGDLLVKNILHLYLEGMAQVDDADINSSEKALLQIVDILPALGAGDSSYLFAVTFAYYRVHGSLLEKEEWDVQQWPFAVSFYHFALLTVLSYHLPIALHRGPRNIPTVLERICFCSVCGLMITFQRIESSLHLIKAPIILQTMMDLKSVLLELLCVVAPTTTPDRLVSDDCFQLLLSIINYTHDLSDKVVSQYPKHKAIHEKSAAHLQQKYAAYYLQYLNADRRQESSGTSYSEVYKMLHSLNAMHYVEFQSKWERIANGGQSIKPGLVSTTTLTQLSEHQNSSEIEKDSSNMVQWVNDAFHEMLCDE